MHDSIGDNINGPSVIKVPSWIQGLGKYYMYFGHHDGTFIRMAYANAITGPYAIYTPGVLDLSQTPLNGVKAHIASPDVLINEFEKKLWMLFHVGGRQNNLTFHYSLDPQCTWGQITM